MLIVILAAGEGKRMRPLTGTRLKSSLLIHNHSLLLRLATMLYNSGLMDRLVVVISQGQIEAMRELFASMPFVEKVFFAVQDPPLGTGDAVAKAEPFLGSEEHCLVVNGDILAPLESLLSLVVLHYKKVPAKCSLVVFRGKDERYGHVQISPSGKVLSLKEKPSMTELKEKVSYINAGIYLFNREIFEVIRETPLSPRGEYELTDAITLLGQRGEIVAVQANSWMSLENPLDLFKAQTFFAYQGEKECMQFHTGAEIGFKTAEEIFFDAKTTINFSNITIKGPVLLGKGTFLDMGVNIGPNVYLGIDCEIGPRVQLQNSLLMERCKIDADCTIHNLLTAEELLIGKGVIINPKLPTTSNVLTEESFVVIGGRTIITSRVEITRGMKINAHSVIHRDTEHSDE